MDLGEKHDLCDYEKIHHLIENTYRNILKNYNPGVKQLIVLGKALQKTIKHVGTSLKAYNECLYDLARSAESCRGATKDIGSGLMQLTDAQNLINQQTLDSIKTFHAELLIPLKVKQENEFRHTQVIYDKYISGHKYHSNNLRKAQNVLEKFKKKSKSKSGQKEMEKTRHMKDCKQRLEEYLHRNLRLALVEERKRYCYLFNRLISIVEDKVNKHNKANERLTEGLRTWPELCRCPHILPQASEKVIHEFGLSDEAFDTEEEQSGDGDHGIDGRAITSSLNRLKRDGPHGYDWTTTRRLTLDAPTITASAAAAETVGSGSETVEEVTTGKVEVSIAAKPTFTLTPRGVELPEVRRPGSPTPAVLCAVYPYIGATEIQLSLEAGDVIRVFGDVHNGWLYGKNLRTTREGWFPLSFTDFAEGLRQLTSSQLSHPHQPAHTRTASLTNIRSAWHREVAYDHGRRRSSRSSETDAAELAGPAVVVKPATAPAERPTTLSASPGRVADQQGQHNSRPKSRQISPLEPISENIPPPDEFRDDNEKINSNANRSAVSSTESEKPKPISTRNDAHGKPSPISTANGDRKSSEPGAGSQTTDATRRIAISTEATPTKNTAEKQNGTEAVSTGSAQKTISVRIAEPHIVYAVPNTLPPPPSPLPPAPPPAPNHLSARLPRPASSTLSLQSQPSPQSRSSLTVDGFAKEQAPVVQVPGGTPVVAGQAGSYAPGTAAGATEQQLPPPPAPPPPPPPPPLPMGLYTSIRTDAFGRPRLRKAGSMESTKTN